MNENVKFLKGTQDSFNGLKSYQPGAFYLVIDDTYKQDGITPNNQDTFGKPSRLYYGVSETVVAPVNQGITTVKTQNDLPKGDALTKIPHGSFYYVSDDNILAIANGNGWVQANVDTTLDTINSDYDLSEIAITNGKISADSLEHSPGKKLDEKDTTFNDVLKNNVTSLLRYVSNITDTAGNIIPQHLYMGSTGPIKLRQETITWTGDGIDSEGKLVPNSVEYTKPVLYIEGTDISYDLGIDYSDKNKKELSLKLSKTETKTGLDTPAEKPTSTPVSTLKIKGGTNISFAKNAEDSSYSIVNDGKISDISVTTETQANEPLGSGDTIKKDNDGFKVTLKSNMVEGGEALTTTFDPIIEIGDKGSEKQIHFNGGTAKLPVYTINEVDKIYRDLNAMVYRGAVSVERNNILKLLQGSNEVAFKTNELHNGDIYICKKVYDNGDNEPTFNGQVIKVGDLIICQGEENEDKDGFIKDGGVSYQIIPSGDEPITSFTTDEASELDENNNPIPSQDTARFVSSVGDNEALEYSITGNNEIKVSTTIVKDTCPRVTGTVGHTTAAVDKTGGTLSQITFNANDGNSNAVGAKKLIVPFYDIAKISKYGHIEEYAKKELIIEDTHADLRAGMATKMDDGNTSTTVSITTTLNKDNNEEDIELSPFKVTSDTLTVTCINPAEDDQNVKDEINRIQNSTTETPENKRNQIAALSVPSVKLEMVWGSF